MTDNLWEPRLPRLWREDNRVSPGSTQTARGTEAGGACSSPGSAPLPTPRPLGRPEANPSLGRGWVRGAHCTAGPRAWRGTREKMGRTRLEKGVLGTPPDPSPHPASPFPQRGQGARVAERCKRPQKTLPERHENEVNKRDKNGNIKTATSSLLITKQAAGAAGAASSCTAGRPDKGRAAWAREIRRRGRCSRLAINIHTPRLALQIAQHRRLRRRGRVNLLAGI